MKIKHLPPFKQLTSSNIQTMEDERETYLRESYSINNFNIDGRLSPSVST